MNPNKPKISDLETGVTYLLCPEKSCKLFFDTSQNDRPCENRCPYQEKLRKIIKCLYCSDLIDLPGNYSMAQTVSHECENGNRPVMVRERTYVRIYKRPQISRKSAGEK